MEHTKITVETTVNAPMERVWDVWTKPEHITTWAFGSDDWEAPSAENDLRVGGRFNTRMQAKDGSAGFDLTGTYTDVKEHALIEYDMDGDDHRHVVTVFTQQPDGVLVATTFDAEHENPEDMQRGGWQTIMNNFKKSAERA